MSWTTLTLAKSCWKVASCCRMIPFNQLMRGKSSVKLKVAGKEVLVEAALTKQGRLCIITSQRKAVEDLTSPSIPASIKLQISLPRLQELSAANTTVTSHAASPQKSPKRTRLLLLSLRWKLTCQLWTERFTLLMMKSLWSRLIVTSIVGRVLHSISTSVVGESHHICHRRRRQDHLRDTWKEVVSDRHLFRAVTLSSELMSETKLELVESQAMVETIRSNIAIQVQRNSQGDSIYLRRISKAQSRNLAAPSTPT